jgi:PAS domain S-box-containing protein
MKDDLFRRYVLESPDAVLVTRLDDGCIVEANEAFLRMTGYRRDEIIGHSTLDAGFWANPEVRSSLVDELTEKGAVSGVIFNVRTRSGELKIMEVSGQLIEFKSQTCHLAIGRDVTARERSAEDLRATHETLRATIESTNDGILVVDETGHTTHANARFAEMWRIPDELLATQSDERLLAFVLDQLLDPEEFLGKVRDLYGTDQESFDTLHFKDGRLFERYSRPLLNEGRATGRVWSFRDVTHRRTTEEAMRSTEAKYRTLVEQIPAITYIDAFEGPETTIYISPQTEAMLGYTQQEWFDDPDLLSKRIHPEDHERWRAEVERCDQTGDSFRLEYRILARDGRVVWVHDESVLLRDESGKPLFWQGVMFDITERKDAEEKLEQAWQREMEAGHRLRALDEMKNTFLEAVSHELRTPLTTILGSALTLEREDMELGRPEVRDLVKRMAANARKLNVLLSDLLDLDRLARGIVEPKRQPTDVAALVRSVVEEAVQGVDRRVELDTEPVEVWVDAAKVERIVENLVVNAFRHTPAGSGVWVRVRSHHGGVLIVVEDSGPGIPESESQAIFEPFRQLPSGQPHSPGVGIGLSLVARFAEIHGGRAWVEARSGGGASFRVFLPGRTNDRAGAFEDPAVTEAARA